MNDLATPLGKHPGQNRPSQTETSDEVNIDRLNPIINRNVSRGTNRPQDTRAIYQYVETSKFMHYAVYRLVYFFSIAEIQRKLDRMFCHSVVNRMEGRRLLRQIS